jgi:hypothetical protein
MRCSDPLVEFLKSFGYCCVLLPRADIRPLRLLVRDGGALEQLGDLAGLFTPGAVPLPPVRENVVSGALSGRRSGSLSAGIGFSLLGGVLSAMGAPGVDLRTMYRGARTVTLRFDEIQEDSVDLLSLDRYLGAADLDPGATHTARLLEADELYVTTAVLKSRGVTVTAGSANGAEVSAGVSVVQDVVGARVAVASDAASRTGLTYRGEVPLVFGFKAVRISYEDGRYTALAPVRPGAVLRGSRFGDDGAETLYVEGPFARLRSG